MGFGRFGQVIGRLLMANKMRITVLERDISAVNLMRKYGYKVYYGDATQVDLLRSAGAEAAESIVITCNEPEDTMKLVEICQQHFPHLHILARARGRVEAHELLQAGVTQFSRETFSSALELGRKTLVTLGMHPHQFAFFNVIGVLLWVIVGSAVGYFFCQAFLKGVKTLYIS